MRRVNTNKDIGLYLREIAERVEEDEITLSKAKALREICNAISYTLQGEQAEKEI
jgi:hypothetical protein